MASDTNGLWAHGCRWWWWWFNIEISKVTGRNFTGLRNRGKRNKNPILKIFICFGDIRRRTSKFFEIGPNFACFFPPEIFFGVRASKKILDRHYKLGPSTDRRAKFHVGRPTHLGDLASEKNETSGLKLKPALQAIASVQTNKCNFFSLKFYV